MQFIQLFINSFAPNISTQRDLGLQAPWWLQVANEMANATREYSNALFSESLPASPAVLGVRPMGSLTPHRTPGRRG